MLIFNSRQYQAAKIDIFFHIQLIKMEKNTFFLFFFDMVYLSVSLSKVFKTSFLMYG